MYISMFEDWNDKSSRWNWRSQNQILCSRRGRLHSTVKWSENLMSCSSYKAPSRCTRSCTGPRRNNDVADKSYAIGHPLCPSSRCSPVCFRTLASLELRGANDQCLHPTRCFAKDARCCGAAEQAGPHHVRLCLRVRHHRHVTTATAYRCSFNEAALALASIGS